MTSHASHAKLAVACISVVFTWSAVALGNFGINAVKTDQGTKDIVDLYVKNDGINGTGVGLEGYEFTYDGTPIQFASNRAGVDIYNIQDDPAMSWLRLNDEVFRPYYFVPTANDPAWRAPIGHFRVTYIALDTTDQDASQGLGAKIGRLVLPDGGSFSLSGPVGGEIGAAGTANLVENYYVANIAPKIAGGGTIAGNPAARGNLQGSTITHRVSASDDDGEIVSFTLQDLDSAADRGFSFNHIDTGDYDITWDPTQVVPGTYRFSMIATDSSIQSNGTTITPLSIIVTPEPTSAALLLMGVLGLSKRRRSV